MKGNLRPSGEAAGTVERPSVEALGTVVVGTVVMMVCVIITALVSSCKSVEYVALPEQHTEHHWHKDSIIKTDSVIREKQTTIRELDSAAMAEYGIRLRNAERAFLIQTREFEKQIQQLMEQKSDTVIKTDSVQVPIPIERKLSRWESFCLDYGKLMLGGSIVAVILAVVALVIWLRRNIFK